MNGTDTDKLRYDRAISYLYSLQKYGIKFGLDNTVRLMSLLGNPQESFQSIHVAGTNGKGSTSAMTASMLQAAGFKVGLFTSPHLVSFTERIRVNSREIEEHEVVEFAEEIRQIVVDEQGNNRTFSPTFFEFVTAMAFLYFKRKDIEWAVVETGMGGRLDATNILAPRVSVITRIRYDHREFLGETLREIATEKAGIIKSGIPVVSASQEPEAMDVIKTTAFEKGSDLSIQGRDFTFEQRKIDMSGCRFDYHGKNRFTGLFVPLSGEYQIENASVAVKAFELVMGDDTSLPSVKKGLAGTRWPGRLELLRMHDRPYDFLIDGAHNPDAAETLASSLRKYFLPSYDRLVLILGIMADKDMEGIMKPLLPLAAEVICAAPGYARAASPARLAELAMALGFMNPKTAESVRSALETAQDICSRPGNERDLIVITGSFYTIGEAKTALGSEGVLTKLQESS